MIKITIFLRSDNIHNINKNLALNDKSRDTLCILAYPESLSRSLNNPLNNSHVANNGILPENESATLFTKFLLYFILGEI